MASHHFLSASLNYCWHVTVLAVLQDPGFQARGPSELAGEHRERMVCPKQHFYRELSPHICCGAYLASSDKGMEAGEQRLQSLKVHRVLGEI